jgi:hypothetical protein
MPPGFADEIEVAVQEPPALGIRGIEAQCPIPMIIITDASLLQTFNSLGSRAF